MQNKKVLVIGASSFIGSHAARFLSKKGFHVEVVIRNKKKLNQIVEQLQIPKEAVHIADITKIKSLEKILTNNFDFVINFAGFSGKLAVQKRPLQSFTSNVTGTVHLLDVIRRISPASKVILLNSMLQEMPNSFISLYGVQKKTANLFLSAYKKIYGIQGTSLILGNIYGINLLPTKKTEHNVINALIKHASNKGNLPVFGNGKQLRDYLYVEDFLELLSKIINHYGKLDDSYQVGYGTSISFQEMVTSIAKQFETSISFTGWPDQIQQVEQGDITLDTSHTQKTFRWSPKFDHVTGIKKCFELLNHES